MVVLPRSTGELLLKLTGLVLILIIIELHSVFTFFASQLIFVSFNQSHQLSPSPAIKNALHPRQTINSLDCLLNDFSSSRGSHRRKRQYGWLVSLLLYFIGTRMYNNFDSNRELVLEVTVLMQIMLVYLVISDPLGLQVRNSLLHVISVLVSRLSELSGALPVFHVFKIPKLTKQNFLLFCNSLV